MYVLLLLLLLLDRHSFLTSSFPVWFWAPAGSQLWLVVFVLCLNGFGLGISIMPSLPEIISSVM